MCSSACLQFGRSNLTRAEIQGRSVLEVGSRIVQRSEMSLRAVIEPLSPGSYVGVDIVSGIGVDVVCDAEDLRERFGDASFDVVVSTEMLEHVRNWRPVVASLKRVVRPGGVLLVTTRSYGFPYHAWPHDYWRYEVSDMRTIFGDFDITTLLPDPQFPGVFLKATRPDAFRERDLSQVALFSVVKQRRAREITARDERLFRAAYRPVRWIRRIAPRRLKLAVKRTPVSRERRAQARALGSRGDAYDATTHRDRQSA